MIKRKTIKFGLGSLLMGLFLVSLTFLRRFSADSVSDTFSGSVFIIKTAVVLGFVLIILSAYCFIAAVTAKN